MSLDKSPKAVFMEALEREDPVERARFLDDTCGEDVALRERVEKLLRAHDEAGGFFSQTSKVSPSVAAAGSKALPLTEKAGDRIGRYKLLQQIGEGGCGVVYMAEQEEAVRRRVALKVIKLGMDTKQVIARFEAERQALAMMDHPNIARVLDAGATDSGRPFFVMELVRGTRITEFCDEKELSTQERLDLFLKVCSAIQHAHQKGVIHRDVKPSNILVTTVDGVALPKVIDFGIAKATNNQPLTDKTLFTAFEQFIGTPAYMSPEQAELSGVDIDTRTDIYSLGVVLYELLTGGPPFDQKKLLASGLDAMRRTIREEEPPPPSSRLSTLTADELTTTAKSRHTEPPKLIHEVRGDLDWIALKCLEKDRARRYETANALAMDLRRHLDCEPVVARPPSRWYEFQKTARRHKFGFAAAGAVIIALAIGLGASTWQFVLKNQAYGRATKAEQEQNRQRQIAETKEKQSRQVAQFLKEMLKSVEPSVALGRDTAMLREILDKTAERVGKSLHDQPEVQAELLSTIGVTYFGLGDAQKAAEIHREALRLRMALFGETNVWVAASLNDLGEALGQHQDIPEAQALLRQALAIRRLVLGNNHPDTARSLTVLAGLLLEAPLQLRNLPESESLQREALAIQTNLFPNGNDDMFESLNNLGAIVATQNRLAEAETIHYEALKLSRKLHGDEHPDVATALTRLGRLLVREGKSSEAETLLRDGYLMRKKFLGNDHHFVASSLDSYAGRLNAQGKFAEAEAVLRENWKERSSIPPLTLLDEMVKALSGQSKTNEALEMFREWLDQARGKDGRGGASTDPELAWVLHHYANALWNLKDFKNARPFAEEAWTLYQQHPDWPENERHHASQVLHAVLTALDDQPALESLQRELRAQLPAQVAQLRKAAERGDPESLNNLAWLLATCPDSGLRDGKSAVAFAEKAVAATLRKNAAYLDTLAAAYAEAGQFAKAVSVQNEAIALLHDEKMKEDLASRLRLYQSNSPYRETDY